MRNIKNLATIILLSTLMAMTPGTWDHLGSRKVNFGIDHDRISVTSSKGAFSKLKLNVTGNLTMHKMKVNYRNGTSQVLNIKCHFIKGQDSRVIDLKGGKRVIQSVDLWYDTKNRARKRATVHLYGRH